MLVYNSELWGSVSSTQVIIQEEWGSCREEKHSHLGFKRIHNAYPPWILGEDLWKLSGNHQVCFCFVLMITAHLEV